MNQTYDDTNSTRDTAAERRTPLNTYNLLDQPWIDCVHAATGQPVAVGLATALARADELAFAVADPLVESAIVRLVAAIGYAAGVQPADQDAYHAQIRAGAPDLGAIRAYLDRHQDEFDLLHPTRPFGQDATLWPAAGSISARPAVYLDMTAAIDRPLLVDYRHTVDAPALPVRDALHALLAQNMWGPGGRLQGKATDLGSNYGIPAPLTGRIVVYPLAATLAQTLAWRLVPTDQPGDPTWTFTARAGAGPHRIGGEADALTWYARRVLLVPQDTSHGAMAVRRVLIGRGLSYRDLDVAAPTPGWADVVTTAKKPLSGHALRTAEDLVPVVACVATALPQSFLACASAAARHLGISVPMVAVSLVASRGEKKLEIARRVPIPASVLTNPAAVRAAQVVTALRSSVRGRVEPGFGIASYRVLLDSPGTTQDRAVFLNDLSRHAAATTNARPAHAVVTAAKGARVWNTAATTLEVTWPMPDPPHGEPAPDAPTLQDFADRFDPSLFTSVTAGTTSSPTPRTLDRSPVEVLMSRLAGYVARGNRAVLAGLRDYAARPHATCPAVLLACRDLPAQYATAAPTTAALYACWHQGKNQATSGPAALPRVARTLGTTKRGPAHQPTRRSIDRALRTRARDLLPILKPLVTQLGRADVRLSWTDLFLDLVEWDIPVSLARQRWASLFYTATPAPEILASHPRQKDNF